MAHALEQQIQDLIDSLKAGLLEYKDKRPHLSWRAVSKNCNVNRYFIKKIVEDDGTPSEAKTIEMGQALVLLEFLSERTSLKAVWDTCPGYMKPLWKEAVRASRESIKDLQDEFHDCQNIWERIPGDNVEALLVVMFACFSKALSRKQVTAILGNGAASSIDHLIRVGVLQEVSGRLRVIEVDDKPFLLPRDFVRRMIPEVIERFAKQNAQDDPMLCFGADNVSRKSLEQLDDIQREINAKILTFIRDCEPGDHPVFLFSGIGQFPSADC